MPPTSTNTNPQVEKPRRVFPYLNGLGDSISQGERIEAKTRYLKQFEDTLVGLESIARSLTEISELKGQKDKLQPGSKDLPSLNSRIEDNLITLRQILADLNHTLPQSGFEKVGTKTHISVLGQDDFIGILYEKFREKETTDLLEVANKVRKLGISSVPNSEMASVAAGFISKNHGFNQGERGAKKQISLLMREGNTRAAETFIEGRIRTAIPGTESAGFKEMANVAGLLPGREILSELRYKFTTPSTLVNPAYDIAFSIYAKDPLKHIAEDEIRSVTRLRDSLWDHKVEWSVPTQAEADVRFIETAYATNKRLGNLFSSLRSSLSEIDKLKPELRETARKATLTQFWKLYEETPILINHEFKNSLFKVVPELNQAASAELNSLVASILTEAENSDRKGTSLTKKSLRYMIEVGELQVSDSLKESIRENRDLRPFITSRKGNSSTAKLMFDLAQPYEDLSNALASKAPQSIESFYSGDTLSSTSKTFSKTLELTNDAFNIVGNGLENIQASPENVMKVLHRFKALNGDHPESALVNDYVRKFKIRFGELGID